MGWFRKFFCPHKKMEAQSFAFFYPTDDAVKGRVLVASLVCPSCGYSAPVVNLEGVKIPIGYQNNKPQEVVR